MEPGMSYKKRKSFIFGFCLGHWATLYHEKTHLKKNCVRQMQSCCIWKPAKISGVVCLRHIFQSHSVPIFFQLFSMFFQLFLLHLKASWDFWCVCVIDSSHSVPTPINLCLPSLPFANTRLTRFLINLNIVLTSFFCPMYIICEVLKKKKQSSTPFPLPLTLKQIRRTTFLLQNYSPGCVPKCTFHN